VLESAPVRASLDGPAEPRQRGLGRRHSFTVAYELWLDSWEAALAALATASRSRMLSTTEAAAHRAAIAAERELVTRQFTLLLGHQVGRGP
jgi:hypothetical protein